MRSLKTVALCGIVVAWLISPNAAEDGATKEAAPVDVSEVVERSVSRGQTFVGTVLPAKTSTIGSAVDGRVLEFLISEGQAVNKGQVLARLRTDTLNIELAAAKANLRLREQELLELQNGSLQEEKDQAAARLAGAKLLLTFSESKFKRIELLFRKGRAATAEDVEEAQSLWGRAEQSFLAAKAASALVSRGPRIEQIEQAKARAAVQTEQVRLIEDKILKHSIVAPFDGYITAEHTQVGEWVSQGDPIAEVIVLDAVDIQVAVVGDVIPRLKRGETVRIEVSVLPGDVFIGTVEQIVPKADPRSRTFPVKIRVQNTKRGDVPRLIAGLLARVHLPTGTEQRAKLVPKDALVLDRTKRSVFVIDVDSQHPDRGVARFVPVELGVADGGLIQVLGTRLKSGQLVVVRGNERLEDGQAVAIKAKIAVPAAQTTATAAKR